MGDWGPTSLPTAFASAPTPLWGRAARFGVDTAATLTTRSDLESSAEGSNHAVPADVRPRIRPGDDPHTCSAGGERSGAGSDLHPQGTNSHTYLGGAQHTQRRH